MAPTDFGESSSGGAGGGHIVPSEGWISKVRSSIYASFFGDHNPVSTPAGFHKILSGIPDNSTILDVGCGDGLYYTVDKIQRLIRKKNLQIYSIDVDAGAVPICKKRIQEAGLAHQVKADAIDLLAFNLEPEQPRYDVVLFMESFPVIGRPLMAQLINKAKTLGTQIQLYHNLVERKDVFMTWMKPRIKLFTLVDFGALTSVKEQETIVEGWGVTKEKYNIEPLLSCTYGEMSKILNIVPFVRSKVCTQYLVSIRNDAK